MMYEQCMKSTCMSNVSKTMYEIIRTLDV